MKKLVLLISLIIISCTCTFASILPRYTTSVKNWGIGILRLTNLTVIYEEPDENSDVIQKIYWDNLKNYNTLDGTTESDAFVAYVPEKNYAFLTVEDEKEDWLLVCYNQKDLKYGWVKNDNTNKFYTWGDFIGTLGKKKGLYVFNDVKREARNLYASPEDDAKTVDRWEVAKYVQPWLVNGNYVMVKLLNYDNKQKTGYMNWRDNNGRLRVFVNLKN